MIADDGLPTDTFNGYITSLITNAKAGNAKAIETINRAIEDDILKSEVAITGGVLINIHPQPGCEPINPTNGSLENNT